MIEVEKRIVSKRLHALLNAHAIVQRDIQAELVQMFPRAARILGSDSVEERQRNVELFQRKRGGASLCICSLEAASHGFTLTASANVAFLELGWTPAKHDQAEDRVHRIGQDRHVTAWYLLAAETIDETMIELISRKRGIVGAVTDGRRDESEALIQSVVRELRGTKPRRHLRSVA